MNKLISSLLTVMLLAAALPAFAADITLNWDPSPSSSVVGYKVYYKADSAEMPFDGIGANEGPSPVDVGDNLTTTLTGLNDTSDYYFTVTAYDSAGNESSPANVVSSSSFVPDLLAPAPDATNEPIPVTFRWSTTPNMAYTLYYGTTPELAALPAPLVAGPAPFNLSPVPIITALLLSLGLALIWPRRQKRFRFGYAAAALTLCILTACGGGGGGDGSTGDKQTSITPPSETAPADTPQPPPVETHEVVSVDVGASDYYQAYDLEPGTTYYWKVVGQDMDDPTISYSSATSQFTTEIF